MTATSLLLAALTATSPAEPTLPDLETIARLEYEFAPTNPEFELRLAALQEVESLPEPVEVTEEFGVAGSMRWTLQGAYGYNLRESQFVLGGAGFTYFIADGFSVNFELNGVGFWQPGPEAAGLNFNVLFRWHFLRQDTWSLFADGGAGFLLTTNDVPQAGTSYNFTPQGGVGVSFDVGATSRMLVGVRWHHISNANLSTPNPGRDSLEFWAGASFAF